MALHCPECGFVNAEGANFCQNCGAPFEAAPAGEPATATYRVGETGDFVPVDLSTLTEGSPALIIRAGGGRAGESFSVVGERMTIGRRPDSAVFLDDVTVSRDHALLVRRGNDWFIDDCGSLNGTYVNRERIDSRRLADGDELQVGKYKLIVPIAMSTIEEIELPEPQRPPQKASTIGAVCKALSAEFPDISISKIRYLEDQRLVSPRRTPGGYRLNSPSDDPRLSTILRLQRDQFRAKRVIRQELSSGAQNAPDVAAAASAEARRRWRPNVSVSDVAAYFTLEDVLEETQADPKLVAELEDYGVIKGELRAGRRYYDDTEREIVRAVTELARYGVGGRNLRVFRSSADREANLLQQILAPALRSRNPERRKEAVEALENLAAVASHLKHLLLVRDLRKIAN